MKIGIIGANSFCGAAFLEYCLHLNYECVATYCNRRVEVPNGSLAKWHKFDLSHQAADLGAMLSREGCEVIVNFASMSMVAESWVYPATWYDINVTQTSKLLESLRTRGVVRKYIHFSTPEVYGDTVRTIREDEYFSPSTPYAVSRLATDLHLKALHRAYGFPVIITRAANVYGPGQQAYRLVTKAFVKAMQGEPFPLEGTGDSVRAWLHRTDMVKALIHLIEHGRIGETYHITSDQFATTKRIVEMIYERVGVNLKFEEGSERTGKDRRYLMSPNKLGALGWWAEVGLGVGLRNTHEWGSGALNRLKGERVTWEQPYPLDQDMVSVG